MQPYHDYIQLGLKAIPIEWDSTTNAPKYHPKGWQQELTANHNGLMIQTDGDVGCIDFDLKNTAKKNLFDEWMAVANTADVLHKVYIEKTRNNGYHVWIKYSNLPKKTPLAEGTKGEEVIALYSKGPLVYTWPTPGYTQVHQSMEDLEELTQAEYEYLIELSQYYNEYKPNYDPTRVAVSYPKGYEEQLSNYDNNISDDGFMTILDLIGLEPCSTQPRKHFEAWRRKGSESQGISAKVYFKSKRVLLFTASLHQFPNWHNKDQYPCWALTPSFVLFYHLNRDWDAVLKFIGITKPKSEGYPLHIFPKELRDSILEVARERSLAPQFIATACLWTISSLAGTRYTSELKGAGRCIMYALLSGPVSVGKTPAMEVASKEVLNETYATYEVEYNKRVKAWEEEALRCKAKKEPFNKPKPKRYLPFLEDGTTEGYISKSIYQPNGLGVYHDEAESILGSGNYKKNNDSISFWTIIFNGGRYASTRANEENERVVPNINCNLLMGTQPARLNQIFPPDKISSGFASRFLIVSSDYIELNTQASLFSKKRELCNWWRSRVINMFYLGDQYNSGEIDVTTIEITDEAKQVMDEYHRQNLIDANVRIKGSVDAYIIGTEAKMSTYFTRFCIILTILHDYMKPVMTAQIVHDAYELYRYHANETIKVIGSLKEEIDTGLPPELRLLVDNLPEEFTSKEASEICVRLNMNKRKFELAMRSKDFASMFEKTGRGKWGKKVGG